MTKYTEKVDYQSNQIGASCFKIYGKGTWVPKPFKHSPIWERIHQEFDPEHFMYPSIPLDVGYMPIANELVPAKFRVLRCTLKTAQMDYLLVPDELQFLSSWLSHLVALESFINPNFLNMHAHVTVDHGWVLSGNSQRVSGWHIDGFQGVRAPRHQIEHSWLYGL